MHFLFLTQVSAPKMNFHTSAPDGPVPYLISQNYEENLIKEISIERFCAMIVPKPYYCTLHIKHLRASPRSQNEDGSVPYLISQNDNENLIKTLIRICAFQPLQCDWVLKEIERLSASPRSQNEDGHVPYLHSQFLSLPAQR